MVESVVADAKKIVDALRASGLAFICASCEHAWKAFTNKESNCAKVLDAKFGRRLPALGGWCGGPSSGRGFPMYEGPLTFGKLPGSAILDWCFVCGEPASHGLKIAGERTLAICSKHNVDRIWAGGHNGDRQGGLGEALREIGSCGRSADGPEPGS